MHRDNPADFSFLVKHYTSLDGNENTHKSVFLALQTYMYKTLSVFTLNLG